MAILVSHLFLRGEMSEFYEGGLRGKEVNAVSLIDAVFRWCEAVLKCSVGFDTALGAISYGIGAEAIAVSRVWNGRNGTKIIVHDREPASSSRPKLNQSYSSDVLGDYLTAARKGTVWLQSVVKSEPSGELALFHSRRSMRELAIIPLEKSDNTFDFLEVHFPEPLSPMQHVLLNALAQTLGEAWGARKKGVFVANIVETCDHTRSLTKRNILRHDNPANLSRAEFRVCLFLSNGYSVQSICSELSVSRSTLQTHLRNIYAKTSTQNLPDLLYILLKKGCTASGEPLDRIA
ncbi:helix-turn-helix transcriptional regulator [Aliiruegeria lutimaris]|nr:helix-turn-helix transcriptional regulator [Aliiruegeria lutimaris]